jgi:hypothetical protein
MEGSQGARLRKQQKQQRQQQGAPLQVQQITWHFLVLLLLLLVTMTQHPVR